MLYHLGPNPTVDLIVTRTVDGEPQILLIERSVNSSAMPGRLAFPGGFVDTEAPVGEAWKPGVETWLEAVRRELLEETGLDLSHKPDEMIRFLGVYDDPGRDPRNTNESWVEGHVFTIAIDPEEGNEVIGMDDAQHAHWYPVSDLNAMEKNRFAFDHYEILTDHGFLSV
jgi:ADP-ribose pyrophosphatase YjhB (NUDIX family)